VLIVGTAILVSDKLSTGLSLGRYVGKCVI
jgi:hypothetical protein